MEDKSYTMSNFKSIPQIKYLSEEQMQAIEIVGSVLPFKSNNYVVENLIDWSKVPDDPLFIMTFPQKGMLLPEHYEKIESLFISGADTSEIKREADQIRLQLNPHPAGQMEYNVPVLEEAKMYGTQHKYRETVLFFPSQGQTCHAYCTFCFRWPQFVGMGDLKFATKEIELLVKYIAQHPGITDVLFTGGDPLIMNTKMLSSYIEPLLESDLYHLRNIRIGTKALAYWPYRFIEGDADELLELFRRVKRAGKHLAFMANFNHPVELEGDTVKQAISRILETGTRFPIPLPIQGLLPQVLSGIFPKQNSSPPPGGLSH